MNQHNHMAKNAQQMLESLERNMTQFHAFQAETLRIHTNYLSNQLECSAWMLQTRQMRFAHELSANDAQKKSEPTIINNPVQLKQLPYPDRLEISPSVCLLTDDGTERTTFIAKALQALGWSLIVLRYPILTQQATLPDGISQIALKTMDESSIKKQLSDLAIQTFVYLHPPFQLTHSTEISFSETETALIKHVFFMAKHLKNTLHKTSQNSRNAFITVARLDGQLGLGKSPQVSPLAGGIFGLTKSLNLEWPTVFCRAIDLDPDLDPNCAASYLIGELYDPDCQLSEVAIGPKGRFTLTLRE